MELTKKLAGDTLTRGDYGVTAEIARRIIFDPEHNGFRKATEADPIEHTDWGVFDPDHGWMLWTE